MAAGAATRTGEAPAAVTGHGLVLAEGDSRALSRAYAAYLAGCCRCFFNLAGALPSALRAPHARACAMVRIALAQSRGPMLNCFAAPSVSTPLRCAELRAELEPYADRIQLAVADLIPHLLLEMALRGLIPAGESFLWEHGAPSLSSLTVGGELVPPSGATGLRFSPSHLAAIAGGKELARVEMRREALLQAGGDGGFRFEPRYFRVGEATHFATVDDNPIAAFEEHPEKGGNHIDLGDRPAAEWVATLAECFVLVERFLPGEYAEMKKMLHQVIPVGYDDHRHLSASYREAIGTVYLTLHPSVMIMTEAVIHEFQHNKFNVAAYGTEFLTNAFHPLYPSPIRPDPRPLWGILLAVHAFLPVAELYRRMRDAEHPLAGHPDFERRLADVDLKNHEGMEMLRANAALTPSGRALMDELEALEQQHLADRTARGLDNTPTEIHLA